MLKSNDASWINTCVDTTFVKLNVDLKCQWEGLEPDYRIYIDDEMFTERTYRWEDPFYLREILQVEAETDRVYWVRLEPVGPQLSTFRFKNPQVEYCDKKVNVLLDDSHPARFTFKVLP